MEDVPVWIEQTLDMLDKRQFERATDTLAKTIYPRWWGAADSVGPNGERNTARNWAREGLRAIGFTGV